MNGPRTQWLDLARGLGIVLVVAGHAERGLVAANIVRGAMWHAFDLGLYTFHMPLFMLLAGMNVRASLRRGRGAFLQAKAWTIAWPYLLWSLVQGGLLVLLAGVTNGRGDWSALIRIGWQPISPFWFLYALMVYMIVVVLVGTAPGILLVLAGAGIVASSFLVGDTIAHQICYQAIFFVTGVLGTGAIRGLPARPTLLIPLAAAWWAAFALMPSGGETPYLRPAALPAAACGIAFMLVVARCLANTGAQALFIGLGRASMTIYVMHILGTAGARIVLSHLHVPQQPIVYWIICTTVGLGAPLLAHRVLARWGGLVPLGLAPRRRIGPRRAPAVIRLPPPALCA